MAVSQATNALADRPDHRVALDDKYTRHQGRVFINGTQALTRLPLLQREADARAGLDTAGFISGYRGSPLGNFDSALWQAQGHLEAARVRFQPGVNEELAATAIWGSQQIDSLPEPAVDGVFAIWYGKGPGVDRCGDVFKHANHQGAHPKGGVLVVCGDDHPGKSSSVSHQSEQALSAALIPCLYPASVQEFIEFGLLGWALSRYSGLWVGFKTVNETIEQTATVDLAPLKIERPDRSDLEAGTQGAMGYVPPIAREMAVQRQRLPLVQRFVRANRIDRQTLGVAGAALGIVSAGKSYQDVLQALRLLQIDAARAAELGLAVYKVGCIWPLEPQGLTAFADGLEELLFVEEKAPFLEPQGAAILYNRQPRPRIAGKRTPAGEPLLPQDVQLEPLQIAQVIVARLAALERADEALQRQAESLRQQADVQPPQLPLMRPPYFCSGCPHNTSTRLPQGSYAMGGIGCHAMAIMTRTDTMFPCQMGGEGANWIGLARYTGTPHIFQNLGDGTYYHSGLLAIRAAVAAGVNITYKILYNDAVAMTGGQPVDGPISVARISHQVLHEGVGKCVVLSDTPQAYGPDSGLAPGVEVHHRDALDRIQRELRETPGCTVLIYEQTCAAEKRRRRKRGQFPNPAKRLYINPAVCEGCGDCSVQSTCVSLQPLPTRYGVKRRIDQSSCNKDYSCNKGFCPSFVTVLGAEPRKPGGAAVAEDLFAGLPAPAIAESGADSYDLMIAGIGGTGVITVGAVLGMAAHLEGRACSIYDMTGLSQKNGAVYSHLRVADAPAALAAQRLGAGEADLVLAFDQVAALSGDALPTYSRGHTRVVGNAQVTPTVRFQLDPDAKLDTGLLQQQLRERAGADNCAFVDATGMAVALCGDTIAANFFLVGFAAQQGLLPVGVEAIDRALELNGVAVALNRRAFALGRLWAQDPGRLEPVLAAARPEEAPADESLEELIEDRTALLTRYQDAAYAARYRALVDRVRAAERGIRPDSEALTMAVARYYAKLLAYKDEYEVARLYAEPAFLEGLRAQFADGFKLRFNLAPPLLPGRDPTTGQPRKREFGPWVLPVFRLLAPLKVLRGTPLDPFGYSAERRSERQLIRDYEALIDRLIASLDSDKHALAVQLAELPEHIRGFGHVKQRHLAAVRQQQLALLEQFDQCGREAAVPGG